MAIGIRIQFASGGDVIPRRIFRDFPERRKFLNAKLLERNGVEVYLLCELRYIEHLFLGLSYVAVNKVAVIVDGVFFQHGKTSSYFP